MESPEEQAKNQKPVIRPVEYSLFCDYATLTLDRKLSLTGVYDSLLVRSLPVTQHQMYVVTKLLLPPGEHAIELLLKQGQSELAKTKAERKVEKGIAIHQHLWDLKNIQIASTQPLELFITIGGKLVYKRPVGIVKVEPKK